MAEFLRDPRMRIPKGEIPVYLMHSGLTASAILLYGVLDSFGVKIFPKIKTIHLRCPTLSAPTIVRSIQSLENDGWIKHKRTGRSSHYMLTMPDWAFQSAQNDYSRTNAQFDKSDTRKKRIQNDQNGYSPPINDLTQSPSTPGAPSAPGKGSLPAGQAGDYSNGAYGAEKKESREPRRIKKGPTSMKVLIGEIANRVDELRKANGQIGEHEIQEILVEEGFLEGDRS